MESNKIIKLDETVVNRIAAGEIIQRPFNALKEMIENSLDAKSTAISVIVKSGGLKSLQITDNGTGIRKDDLDIVCERFTTSKLHNFEDLSKIATYGFRGEALASISHVAHLTIQTKTAQDKCSFKANYEDGKVKGKIVPCAGNQGTQITIEDLFYNMPQRKQILKSANDEFHKISEVMSKYAVHNAEVSFTLKKAGETKPSLRTQANSTQRTNIGVIYGLDVSKNLIEIELVDEFLKLKMKALLTNVNYSCKKTVHLLFINHRLVVSTAIKSAINDVYAFYLPKGSFPFVYMSIEIDPVNVDVNVHPTKHEVHFLHEEEIIERIKGGIEKKMLGSNEARVFYAQALLPGASNPILDESGDETLLNKTRDKMQVKNVVRTDSKVQKLDQFFLNKTFLKNETVIKRESDECAENNDTISGNAECNANLSVKVENIDTSSENIFKISENVENIVKISEHAKNNGKNSENAENIDKVSENIFKISENAENIEKISEYVEYIETSSDDDENMDQISDNKQTLHIAAGPSTSKTYPKPQASTSYNSSRKSENVFKKQTKLTSILKLRKAVEDDCHMELRQLLNNLIFVGSVSQEKALIQHETKLYLCNTKRLSEEFFYQCLLYDFENFGNIEFDPALPLKELATIALESEDSGWTEEDGPIPELVDSVVDILTKKAVILKEYYNFTITSNGMLTSLPLLLENHLPPLAFLPMYLLRLATEVNWEDENEFFTTFSRETAKFYAEISCAKEEEEDEWKQQIEFVIYPALKQHLLPPKSFMVNKSFLQIASLPNLYKVFERC